MTRLLRRGLSDEAIVVIEQEREQGLTPLPVHLMLVDDSGPVERGRTACRGGLGEWITGDTKQVTCTTCAAYRHPGDSKARAE